MKNYVLKTASKSIITKTLCAYMAEGKAGELLIVNGFSQTNFTLFLAKVAVRNINAGADEEKLAMVFSSIAAANSSQARQACKDIVIDWPDREAEETTRGVRVELTLEKHWGSASKAEVSAFVEAV